MEDIFKKSFLEGYASVSITATYVLAALAICFLLSLYIFYAYRIVTRKTFYNRNFAISLVGVALVTTTIIITIQNSVVVSLGMVGALSIVRFRTAIKDPMDLMFLFWSISVGIVCGAGFAEYAVFLSLALTFALFILNVIPSVKAPMILIVNSDTCNNEKEIIESVKKYSKHYTVKSRNISGNQMDMTIELRTNESSELVREVSSIAGVTSASILSHNGEVTF